MRVATVIMTTSVYIHKTSKAVYSDASLFLGIWDLAVVLLAVQETPPP